MASGASKKSPAQTATAPSAAASEARGAATAPPTTGGPARSGLASARMRLKPDQVVVIDRLRPLNRAKVEALKVSYRETGELPPIITRPHDLTSDVLLVRLVAGLHRLEACRELGVPVDCMVRDLNDIEARLVECDENLLGPDLTPYDRAVFIQARMDAWAARFPDRAAAEHGVPAKPKRGRPDNSAKFAEFPLGMGFTAETASDIGLSERTVRAALSVARGLTPASHALLSNTWVARNEGALRQLAGITDPAEQAGALAALLDGRAKTVPDARAIASGTPIPAKPDAASEDPLKVLRKLWKGASQTERDAMLGWLSGQKLTGWTVSAENARG